MRPNARRRTALLSAAAALLGLSPGMASAITVYDPANHAENVLQAARALQQINNQLRSLQNEAAALVNDAKNLASLPYSAHASLDAQLRATERLLRSANRIAFDVRAIAEAFDARYEAADRSATDRALADDAEVRWRDSVAAFEDALKVQAGVVGNIEAARRTMADLVGASQGAVGALQAAQAGNQLLALQTRQLADLSALLAADGRAAALQAARAAAAEAQGQEQLRRFLAPGSGYRPGRVRMFHD